MDGSFVIPALVFYVLSACGFVAARRGNKRLVSYAVAALALGVIVQAGGLIVEGLRLGNMPVANFPEALSFLALLTACTGLIQIVRMDMVVIGPYLGGGVFAALVAAYFMARGGPIVLPQSLRSGWLPVHVTLALLGYALFVLSAGVSVVYLASESRLKSKRLTSAPATQMPSLEKLDRINYRLLVAGFVMLTLAILSGAIWAQSIWGHFWSWRQPQEAWSFVTWCLYAAILESRLTVGWRGRRVATLTIVVFTVLLGSFLGVSLIAPGKHSGNFG